MKTTAEVCRAAGGAKPPESGLEEMNPTGNVKKQKEETEISSRLVNFALLMYKQLTSEQRYTISVLLQRKCTKNEIVHAIGVSNSIVTRELRRNFSSRGVYKWDKAQRLAEKRKHQMPGNRSIKPFVRDMAIGLLKQRQWSPEQISGYLAKRDIKSRTKPSMPSSGRTSTRTEAASTNIADTV